MSKSELPVGTTVPTIGSQKGRVNFPPSIAKILRSQDPGGSQSKQALVKNLVVGHRKFDDVINVVAAVHNAISLSTMVDAEFALIAGVSRAGKTTAIKHYARQFRSHAAAMGMKSPVVYLQAPAECTVLSLLDAVLNALKVPKRGLKTRDDKVQAIVHHLREQEVQLLIVDEYQHFVDKRTNRFQHAAGDLLKGLLNENACQMVFAGLLTSDSATTVNDQAEGRLNGRYEMGPYRWNDPADNLEFRTFLSNVSDQMPFDLRFGMENEKFAIRIYIATDGLVGRVMRLAAKATAIAADRLARKLTMADFADAFDATKKHGVVANPFRGSPGKASNVPLNLMEDLSEETEEELAGTDGTSQQEEGENHEHEDVSEGTDGGLNETGTHQDRPEMRDEIENGDPGNSGFEPDSSDDELEKIDELLGRTRDRLTQDDEQSGLRSTRAPRVRDTFSRTRA